MKIKKIIFAASFALTLSVFSLQPAIAVSASSQGCPVEQYADSVTPRSHIIKWVYKVENNKIYKRLYNASTDTWLTEWTYVGEYTG